MIKLNLSKPIDIDYLFQKYNLNNLYLGYVKGLGYILIHENKNKASFTCIESNTAPDDLNLNWHNDTKEIIKIYSQLDKILKSYIDKTLNGVKGNYQSKIVKDVYVELVSDMLESLEEKYSTYEFAKAKNIKNLEIKQLALNPVKTFNFYLNYNAKPLPYYNKAHEQIENELNSLLRNVVNLFNKNKSILAVYNKFGDTKPIIQETEFIRIFNSIICDSFDNPIVNIKYGNGKQKLNTIEAIDYVTEEFNIKGVNKNGLETIYYYDDLNYFEPLTDIKLKNLISNRLGLKVLKSDYEKIYKSIETTSQQYDNLLVFNNMLFDMDYMEELNFPTCNYIRSDYLAPALIGFETDDNKIHLLNYDNDFDFLEIYNTNPDPKNMTFTEKTLRQILIPKDEPNNLQMFHDFLQRLGACILGVNKFKVITLYYGDGNNGKGILKLLFELIFNRGAYSLTPATFEDSFNLQGFTNRKVLLLDEIDKNDFKNLKPTLKRISSPEARIEQRGMYSTALLVLNNFPMLFIFANDFVKLEMSETALFNRFDFLTLPNYFVDKKELNKKPNSYLVDRNTENKIKSDVDGLSWLITASIKAFVNMENSNNEFILKQTASQTMDILARTDYLTKFISLYTEKDLDLVGNECTTNEEILQQFKQYLEIIGATTTETDTIIKRRIGAVIKQVYDIEGKLKDSEIYHKQNKTVASYKVKLLSFDDLNKEFNRIYIINENATATELVALDFSNDNKLVYNKIQNGTNTINLLNKVYSNFDNYKIVKELLNLNLIIKTTEINLTSEY